MRNPGFIILAFILLNFTGCSTAQKTGGEKTLLKIDSTKTVSQKIYLFKNKKLEVSQTGGSLTYTMVDNDKTNVIQFSYEKDLDKMAYDGGYREEVVFEFPNDTAQQNYADAELNNTKMLFGRYCFCRGYTGLYKVNQGKLHLAVSKKQTHFELQFKVTEVPQVTTEIKY